MQTPEQKRQASREYRSRPEVKERQRQRRAEYFKDPEARRMKILRQQKYREKVRNTPEFKAKAVEYAQRKEVRQVVCARLADKKRKLDLLKMGRPCYDCGGMFPLEAMDWDHTPGSKKSFNVSNYSTRTFEAVLEEIQKCQLVCSNCHRVRTALRRPVRISNPNELLSEEAV